ncbi:histidinol-phosphate transaminase [Selenomonas sp.]|uniref:pyridoxal phosphate-dependent aminotransferase n=1 Tax=Selenomonas sp. TaxID=2053611 RepID=UPI002A753A5D|nr:histidinol-phosphate transaminase [Selenomonas sp.]MDY3298544.1 histidinol-phosphate transaminase [Selenomonas sp.]
MSSRFLSPRYRDITPYFPGEQPKDRAYIKLNANETSCEPAPGVRRVLAGARMKALGRYTEPTAYELRHLAGEIHGVRPEEIVAGNGSDEILGWIFLTFFEHASVCYPDITYGYYESLAVGLGIEHHTVPLRADFTMDVDALCKETSHIVIANPNAPTGYLLPVSDIERIVAADPNRIVVVDEAYVDFHNPSCLPLIRTYDNLIVVQTMSKAYALAGAHIGFAYGCPELMRDLDCVRGVMNPYNISDITAAVGCAALEDQVYLESHVYDVELARDYTIGALRRMGFRVLESRTNFIFVEHPTLAGPDYVRALRAHAILARNYPSMRRAENFIRITIGTMEEMVAVVQATRDILAHRNGEMADERAVL